MKANASARSDAGVPKPFPLHLESCICFFHLENVSSIPVRNRAAEHPKNTTKRMGAANVYIQGTLNISYHAPEPARDQARTPRATSSLSRRYPPKRSQSKMEIANRRACVFLASQSLWCGGRRWGEGRNGLRLRVAWLPEWLAAAAILWSFGFPLFCLSALGLVLSGPGRDGGLSGSLTFLYLASEPPCSPTARYPGPVYEWPSLQRWKTTGNPGRCE